LTAACGRFVPDPCASARNQSLQVTKDPARALARARGGVSPPRPRLFFARAPAHVGPSNLRQLARLWRGLTARSFAMTAALSRVDFHGWEISDFFTSQPFAVS